MRLVYGAARALEPLLLLLHVRRWPKSLETLFVQDTKICSLPASLTGCALKRVNVSHLELDSDGDALAKKMGEMVLGTKDGIFWAKDGAMQRSKAL